MAIERRQIEKSIDLLVFGPPHARISENSRASSANGDLVEERSIPAVARLRASTYKLYRLILDNADRVSGMHPRNLNEFRFHLKDGLAYLNIWRGKTGNALIHINANPEGYDDPKRKALAIFRVTGDPQVYRDRSVKLRRYSPYEDIAALGTIGRFCEDQQWVEIVDEDLDYLVERRFNK